MINTDAACTELRRVINMATVVLVRNRERIYAACPLCLFTLYLHFKDMNTLMHYALTKYTLTIWPNETFMTWTLFVLSLLKPCIFFQIFVHFLRHNCVWYFFPGILPLSCSICTKIFWPAYRLHGVDYRIFAKWFS